MPTEDGKLYLFVAISRTSKFAFVELHESHAPRVGRLPETLAAAVPYRFSPTTASCRATAEAENLRHDMISVNPSTLRRNSGKRKQMDDDDQTHPEPPSKIKDLNRLGFMEGLGTIPDFDIKGRAEIEATLYGDQLMRDAIRVFGSAEAATRWMITPAIGLNQMTPDEAIRQPGGPETVATYLTRIEYGVYC